MAVETYIGTLVIVECYKCNCTFGMPEYMHKKAKELGNEFFCPHGHGQVYTKSENQKLQDELARKEHTIENMQTSLANRRRERDSANRRLSVQRGVTTKLKKRIENGVCPCCHRSFKNLRNHMKMKHPKYSKKKS